MAVSIRMTGPGDAALRGLIEKTKKLGGTAALRTLSGRLAGDAKRLVAQSFASSASPDGEAWAPLKSRRGQPLVKTGKLSRSIRSSHTSKGFTLHTSVRYAAVHQFGAETKARFQARTRKGRFKSRKAADRQKSGKVLVSHMSGATIPARPFFPGGSLPDAWRTQFTTTTREFFREYFE